MEARDQTGKFLKIMNEIISQDEWVGVMTLHYTSGKRGRPHKGIEKMLGIYRCRSASICLKKNRGRKLRQLCHAEVCGDQEDASNATPGVLALKSVKRSRLTSSFA
jgi:hypothetical protein